MAKDTSATIVTLVQPQKKLPLTDAQRAKRYRDKRRAAKLAFAPGEPARAEAAPAVPVTRPQASLPATKIVTRHVTVTPASRRPLASIALTGAAIALAGVGVTMNGWFARSLGSSDIAGWLFLAIGVAADCAALCLPAMAARHWEAARRFAALTGWAVWLATFVFAVTAGIGFASVNIADVTQSRASRVTPAVTVAQNALSDAMTARDRECKGGVGKFCREREAAVVVTRQALDVAMKAVADTADPQVEAARKIVAWITGGMVRPTGDDFAMLRLVLLALLPQIGGILLMVGRTK